MLCNRSLGHAFIKLLISLEWRGNPPHNLLMALECVIKHLKVKILVNPIHTPPPVLSSDSHFYYWVLSTCFSIRVFCCSTMQIQLLTVKQEKLCWHESCCCHAQFQETAWELSWGKKHVYHSLLPKGECRNRHLSKISTVVWLYCLCFSSSHVTVQNVIPLFHTPMWAWHCN